MSPQVSISSSGSHWWEWALKIIAPALAMWGAWRRFSSSIPRMHHLNDMETRLNARIDSVEQIRATQFHGVTSLQEHTNAMIRTLIANKSGSRRPPSEDGPPQ